MSFMSKLAFWKKKDDFSDLGKDLGLDKDFGMGNDFGSDSQGPSPDLGMGMDQGPNQQGTFQKYPSYQQPHNSFSPSMQQPSFQQPSSSSYTSDDHYINSKNLEVISSKLDALRVSLDSINQRLANLESIARGEQDDQRRRRYY